MGKPQLWIIVTLYILNAVCGQENAQSKVALSLQDCYRNRSTYERDNRLPMTINTLIELIRKVENSGEGSSMDITTLTIALVHRFKQDGIVLLKDVQSSDVVLPYSPQGHQFIKHKILLSKLVQGDARNFPNDTLTPQERCTLHFMLSNSIDLHVRGDEAMRCSSLAQYRTNRIPRGVDSDVVDVETFKRAQKVKSSKLRKEDEDIDEYDHDEDTLAPRSYDFGVDTSPDLVSACPVENGVVRTPWGAVSAGTLLTGIAAGLRQQFVRVTDISPRRAKGAIRARQSVVQVVDNRWAATLSGDLAEAALLQGPKTSQIQVGAKGVSLIFFKG